MYVRLLDLPCLKAGTTSAAPILVQSSTTFAKPLESYLCVTAGKLMCFLDKALQAGKSVELNQGHPPEYLAKGGNILISTVRNKLLLRIADIVASLQVFHS